MNDMNPVMHWGAAFVITPRASWNSNRMLQGLFDQKQVFTREDWTTGGRSLSELMTRIEQTCAEHAAIRNWRS